MDLCELILNMNIPHSQRSTNGQSKSVLQAKYKLLKHAEIENNETLPRWLQSGKTCSKVSIYCLKCSSITSWKLKKRMQLEDGHLDVDFCCISNGELPNSYIIWANDLRCFTYFCCYLQPQQTSLHLSFIAQTHQCRHGYAKNCSGNIPIHVLGQHEAVGQDTGTLSTWWDPFFEVLAPFRGHVGIRNVGFAKFSRIIQ